MSRNKLFRVLAPLLLAALMVGLSVALLTTMASARPEQSAAASPRGGFEDEYRNTLRIYGRCDRNAEFPYETITGALSIQSQENPPKDFVVWNPAYLYHMDTDSAGMYGNFFGEIKASGTNANEKVFLRQWYVPKYDEPSGLVWTQPTADCVASPDIVKEYTYMLLDSLTNDPTFGLPGSTSFVFPTARRPADATLTLETYEDQFGLSDYNMNKYDNLATMVLNDKADVVRLETVGQVGTAPFWPPSGATTAYSCIAGLAPGNQIPTGTPWIDLSTGEFQIEVGHAIRFLDHKAVIEDVYPSWLPPGPCVMVDIYYTGNEEDELLANDVIISLEETLSSGRHQYHVQTLTSSPPNPPSRSAEFVNAVSFLRLVQEPWYVQVLDVGSGSAQIRVGRLVVETESFFVNAAEYEIAKLHTPGCGPVEMTDEFLGIADGENVTFTVTVPNLLACGTDPGDYFADCNGDGNVDKDDVTVYVDGVIQDVNTFDICTYSGEVVFDDPPCCDYEVTIDYCYESPGFKYITVRNGLPKYDDVELPFLSIVKHGFDEQELFPLLPPFNMTHDMVDDVNIPDCCQGDANDPVCPDCQNPDNVIDEVDEYTGECTTNCCDCDAAEDSDGFGDQSCLDMDYNTIEERIVEDVVAIVEWFEQEDKEPRFDTNLLEEKFTETTEGEEEWRWKNIETLPWDYTELVLPKLPDITDPDADYEAADGDYILVSSFLTEDSANPWPFEGGPLGPGGAIRMKFYFDAVLDKVNSADIYVNDHVYNQQYPPMVDVASLRVYGRCDENAMFPYETITGPLSIQSPENPPKDFIVWNPAYMNHGDTESNGIYGDFFRKIVVDLSDGNEKVHLRQWYVPKFDEPSGYVWEPQECVASADIVKEYTYILLDANNDPMCGPAGKTTFVFPIADNDDTQTGLDDYDMNGDDEADIVHLETVSNDVPDNTTVYTCTNLVDLSGSTVTPWIDISTGRFVIHEGDVIRFLDHVAVVTGIAGTWPNPRVTVDIYYTGNADDEFVETATVYDDQTASAGRKDAHVQALTNSPPAPPSQSNEFTNGTSYLKLVKEPWYLQVVSVLGDDAANIVVGRLLTEGESFFVDAAEYEVAEIGKEPCEADHGLKLITIRNDIPKFDDVDLHDLSIIKDAVIAEEELPLLPPFNMEHDIIDDINIPDCVQGDPNATVYPDEQYPDNQIDEDKVECADCPSGYMGASSSLCWNYNTIAKRWVPDQDPAVEYFIREEKEPRFDTNLLEEKFTEEEYTPTRTITETWEWKNIETLPWDFTEFVLPPIDDVTATGDYILVSSFLTEDSKDIWPNVGPDGAIRVKFVYDPIFSPDEKTGIYVNTPHECFCFGDFNGDDFRDGADLMLMVQAWNTSFGDEGYEARFDVDLDGDIDITDLMLVAAVWNTPCPAE